MYSILFLLHTSPWTKTDTLIRGPLRVELIRANPSYHPCYAQVYGYKTIANCFLP